MNDLRRTLGGVIAQEIEAGFFGGHVRDVARRRRAAGRPGESPSMTNAGSRSKRAIERRHPLRVPACEVVVGGEDMTPRPSSAREQGGKRGRPASCLRRWRAARACRGASPRPPPSARRRASCRSYVGRDLARHREHLGQQRIDTCHRHELAAGAPVRPLAAILAAVTRSERVELSARRRRKADVVLDGAPVRWRYVSWSVSASDQSRDITIECKPDSAPVATTRPGPDQLRCGTNGGVRSGAARPAEITLDRSRRTC